MNFRMFNTNYPLILLASVSDGSKTVVEDPADSFEANFLVCDLSILKTVLMSYSLAFHLFLNFLYNGWSGNLIMIPHTLSMVLRI